MNLEGMLLPPAGRARDHVSDETDANRKRNRCLCGEVSDYEGG